MSKEAKTGIIVSIGVGIIIILSLYFCITPSGKTAWNNWFFNVQKVDDATNYDTIKKVEDNCRAMIASYFSDKTIFESNKDSDDNALRQMAQVAKIRANNTATTYNQYILKNSFVWKENVPSDIYQFLEILE